MELFLIAHDTQLTLKKNGFLFEYCDYFYSNICFRLLSLLLYSLSLKMKSIKSTLEIIKQILPKKQKKSRDNACKLIYAFLSLKILALRDN